MFPHWLTLTVIGTAVAGQVVPAELWSLDDEEDEHPDATRTAAVATANVAIVFFTNISCLLTPGAGY